MIASHSIRLVAVFGLILCVGPLKIFAQKLDNLTAGASLSYYFEPKKLSPLDLSEYTFHEYSLRLHAGTDWWKDRFRTGIQSIIVHSRSVESQSRTGFLAGLYHQYDIFAKKPIRVYAEVSLNYGNYCTCGFGEPYIRNNLVYGGLGGGVNLPLKGGFFLDFGFTNYEIINPLPDNYNFTQIVAGMTYKIY